MGRQPMPFWRPRLCDGNAETPSGDSRTLPMPTRLRGGEQLCTAAYIRAEPTRCQYNLQYPPAHRPPSGHLDSDAGSRLIDLEERAWKRRFEADSAMPWIAHRTGRLCRDDALVVWGFSGIFFPTYTSARQCLCGPVFGHKGVALTRRCPGFRTRKSRGAVEPGGSCDRRLGFAPGAAATDTAGHSESRSTTIAARDGNSADGGRAASAISRTKYRRAFLRACECQIIAN